MKRKIEDLITFSFQFSDLGDLIYTFLKSES